MAYQISEETKKKTTKCLYNFECLNNDKWNTCSIGSELLGNGLVIENKCNKSDCNYSMLFGYSYYFCHCPTRREIYQTYKI